MTLIYKLIIINIIPFQHNEILSYKKKLKNNLNCELYDELWNTFLNFKMKKL